MILPRTQPADEPALFARWQRGRDPAAREALTDRYLPLARHLARRYASTREPLDDLVQVASVGLLHAIDRYDPGRGVRFATFAVPTIVGELKRHFRDRTWCLHVPRDLQEMALKVERAVERLAGRHGGRPSVADVARELGISEERALEALLAGGAHHAASLDTPRPAAEGEALGDLLGADEPGFARAEDRATLAALLAGLDERERLVLRLRFEEDLTQEAIGRRVGLSQMHVSRLLRRSLASLSALAAAQRRAA